MDLEHLVHGAAEHGLTEEQVTAYSLQSGIGRPALYDVFSRLVAHGFLAGELSYEACDAAMNALYGIALGDIPPYTWSVYLAFDAGEYHHSGDGREVDPVENYTRPAILEIVAADRRT